MIDELKKIALNNIEKYKDNQNELKKYELINKILSQKDCFKNMSIEYVYSILRDLDIKESELKSVYSKLI